MAGFRQGPAAFFRLSPAARAKATAFGLMRGEITSTRFDVNYWRLAALVAERLDNAVYPARVLGGLLTLVQYGCSKLATSIPVGTPILRMNNLQASGWDLTDLKWVKLSASELDTYRLQPDDLLFNRTNSKELVGKCEVFREPGEWVYASYLIRVKTDVARIIPQFAADFLNGRSGRLQIDQLSRQIIGMTNINAEEIKSIRIALPPLARQIELVEAMDGERAQRKAKLAQAEALLTELDAYLLESLDLTPPRSEARPAFAVSMRAIRDQARLNPDYFHPERMLALRALEHTPPGIVATRLNGVVCFVRDQIKTPGPVYLSLAHVQSHTGERVDANEDAAGACSVFQRGDVLFGRLRPYLNKVHVAESDGCCSPEFHVLRIKDTGVVRPDYLGAILRSSLTLAQTRHMMTGNTHPRLSNDDVVNLMIPIPRLAVQEQIVAEVRRRREGARILRAEADAGWMAAGRWFDEQTVGAVAARPAP